MPIVSGGSGGGGVSAMTLLSSTTLAAPGTFDITSGLTGYNDLIVTGVFRGTRAAATDGIYLQLNGDTGTNYYLQAVDFHGATSGPAAFSDVGSLVSVIPAASATANYFGAVTWTVSGYGSTSWNKTIDAEYSSPVTGTSVIWRGLLGTAWLNTAAVTRVTVLGQITAALATGSKLLIYGRL